MAAKQNTDLQQDTENQELESGAPKNKLSALIEGLSARQRILAAVALFCIVSITLYLIAIRPLNNYKNNIQQRIHETKELIPKKLEVLKSKESIWKAKEALKGYWTEKTMTREEEITEFLRIIESVSQRNNLFVSNINPVQINTPEGEATYELSVVLEGAGSVPSVKRFISDLEKSYAPIRVESVNLRSQGVDDPDLRYKFSVIKLGVQAPG